jgi:hypothetical protein
MKSRGGNHVAGNRKPKPPPDDPEQSKRFEETARELGADESGDLFKKAVKAVVPPKQAKKPPAD